MSDTAPTGLALSDEITTLVNDSLETGHPILVAYVNTDAQARLSFRGSSHVHSSDQLGIWVRKAEGGIADAITSNPKLTLMYRDAEKRTTIFFYGRGRVSTNQAEIDKVWDDTPEHEQHADPERKGVAVIVDLDQVQGRTADGPINLTR